MHNNDIETEEQSTDITFESFSERNILLTRQKLLCDSSESVPKSPVKKPIQYDTYGNHGYQT